MCWKAFGTRARLFVLSREISHPNRGILKRTVVFPENETYIRMLCVCVGSRPATPRDSAILRPLKPALRRRNPTVIEESTRGVKREWVVYEALECVRWMVFYTDT